MEDAGIYARESDRLGRPLQIAVASSQVIDVSFPEEIPSDAAAEHPILDRVFDYLDGEKDEFADVDVAITVPTDQRAVLKAVCQIPYGETGNTRQVAHMANLDPDDEDDAATIRAALRANPVPIFVPDHRVDDAPGATPSDVAATLRRIEE
jgi:methylated-DNA-[protein]-cysteine S-methyltransferase